MQNRRQKFLDALYVEQYDKLITYALKFVPSMGQAEEAVQEAFGIACEKVDALMAHPNPNGWLMQTLKNVLRNMRRKQQTGESLVVEYLAAYGTQVASTKDKLPLDVAFHGMAHTEDFKLVKAMAVDGRSHLELAKELGISVDACKKRMQRAKEKLMKKLR